MEQYERFIKILQEVKPTTFDDIHKTLTIYKTVLDTVEKTGDKPAHSENTVTNQSNESVSARGYEDGKKFCPICKDRKPLTEFYIYHKKGLAKPVYSSYCKACDAKEAKKRRERIKAQKQAAASLPTPAHQAPLTQPNPVTNSTPNQN